MASSQRRTGSTRRQTTRRGGREPDWRGALRPAMIRAVNPTMSHQTVRLSAGRHRSAHAGVCVMELASMLAAERFSDRAATVSPVIGAFLRTYNDGIDDARRQDLYPVAALIVGSAAARRIEDERASRCLGFAR